MSARVYRVTLTAPDGTTYDVSDRLDVGSIGTIAAVPESDLTIYSHGEFDFTLRNNDGFVEGLFTGALPSDVWDVRVERQLGGAGPWQTIFGGILDFSTSVQYDDKALDVGLVAYGYSKLLDRVQGDTIARTIGSMTATVANGSNTIVIVTGDPFQILVGDTITLSDDSGNTQDFKIDQADGSPVTSVEKATVPFTKAACVVSTPFYRDKSPAFILGTVTSAAGLTLNDLVTGQPMTVGLVASPVPLAGLNLQGVPWSLTTKTFGGVTTLWTVFGAYTEKRTLLPNLPWSTAPGTGNPHGDWTPYLGGEPATIVEITTGYPDAGFYAFDFTGNHTYRLAVGRAGTTTTLKLLKDEVNVLTLDTWTDGSGVQYDFYRGDLDNVTGYYWYSFRRGDASLVEFGRVQISGPTKSVIDNVTVAAPRICAQLGAMLTISADYTTLKAWDTSTPGSVLWSVALPYGVGYAHVWSARLLGRRLCWICRGPQGIGSYLAVLNADTRAIEQVFPISSASSGVFDPTPVAAAVVGMRAMLTICYLIPGRPVLVGWAGGEWFVASDRYDGVLREADFRGRSCADAIKQLALATVATAASDDARTLTVSARAAVGSGDPVLDVSTPIESVRLPVSQYYRSSVKVSGKAPSGFDVTAYAGNGVDPALQLSIDSTLAVTPAIAQLIANASVAFFGSLGAEVQATVDDDGTPVNPFDSVTYGGKKYAVYSVERDVEAQTLALILLERS